MIYVPLVDNPGAAVPQLDALSGSVAFLAGIDLAQAQAAFAAYRAASTRAAATWDATWLRVVDGSTVIQFLWETDIGVGQTVAWTTIWTVFAIEDRLYPSWDLVNVFENMVSKGMAGLAPSVPGLTTLPQIVGTPAAGATVSIRQGIYSGTTPMRIPGVLTLDGVDVTADMAGLTYTVPADTPTGTALAWTETASNYLGAAAPAGTSQSSTAGAVPSLVPHYGTTAGKIRFDLRLDKTAKMTLSGQNIIGVTNDGGAGAAGNVTAVQNGGPVVSASGPVSADFDHPSSPKTLILADYLDMQGLHLLIPCTLSVPQRTEYIAGSDTTGRVQVVVFRPSATTAYIRIGDTSGTPFAYAQSPVFPITGGVWMLIEIRIAGGRFKLWINGALIGDVAAAAAPHLIRWIGHAAGGSNRWRGRIGREIGVVVSDATSVPQAVTDARAVVAGQYGIAMP